MKFNKINRFFTFSTKSLQHEIQRAVMGVFLILVISYSAALGYYFKAGLSIASNAGFESMAEIYKTRGVKESDIATEPGGFSSYYQYENLPEYIKNIFPVDSIVIGIPEIKFNIEATDESSHLILLLVEELPSGEKLFLTKELGLEGRGINNSGISLDFLEHAIFWGGIGVLLLVYLFARAIVSRINHHISALRDWADGLQTSETTKSTPDFQYEELNMVAERFATSVRRVGDFVDREQSFLRHASHELRTPIAIISGNVSLMKKLELKQKQVPVVKRIERACYKMQNIVTTLLWLSREIDHTPESEPVNLKSILENIIQDHRYLLEGKNISINYKLTDSIVDLPAVPLGIVLANLVRNAFQHTQSGEVFFVVDSEVIQIKNSTSSSDEVKSAFDEEKGIGISLSRRITKRLGWNLSLFTLNKYANATLDFSKSTVAKK